MEFTASFSDKLGSAVHLIIKESNGLSEQKNISFYDFRAAINSAMVTDDFFHVGNLPKGFYDGKISISNPLTFRVAILVPEEVRPLIYFEDTYLVPFPSLLFTFSANGGIINRSECYAVTDNNISGKSKLYRYPYGNVYSDGKICWGTNYIERLSSIANLDAVVGTFFGSATNNDLWQSPDEKRFPQQRSLIEGLNEKEMFPTDLLIPNTYCKNVEELMKKLLETE